MIEQRKDVGTHRDNKADNTIKYNNAIWGNKPKCTGERRKIKEISGKGKTLQTKQDILKQRKKILPTSARR